MDRNTRKQKKVEKGVKKPKKTKLTTAQKKKKEEMVEKMKDMKRWKEIEATNPPSEPEWKCINCGGCKNYVAQKKCTKCHGDVCYICSQKFKGPYLEHSVEEAMEHYDGDGDSCDSDEEELKRRFDDCATELYEELEIQYDMDGGFVCMTCNEHLWSNVLKI